MPAKSKAASNVSSNIWVYVGTDDLKVKEAAQEMVRKLVPEDAGDFGLEIIEGAADNVDHAGKIIRRTIENIQTLPFFGGDKVVWLKGATFLADNVTGRSENTLKALEGLGELLLNGIPSDIRLIITATDVDKRRSFFNTLKKVGNLEVYDAIDTSKPGWEEVVMDLVEDRASEWDMQFEPEALQLFVMLAGEQTRQIDNELEKLDLYVGKGRAVAPDDVRQIVAQTRNGIVWELGDTIGRRDLPRALKVLEQLIYQGENAIGILLAAIVPKIRNLFQARELAESYKVQLSNYASRSAYVDYIKLLERLPEEIIATLPKKKEGGINGFTLFLAAKDMGRFTALELRAALEECLNANRRLVTSGMDSDVVLNQLLMRILSKPAKKPAAR